MRIFSGILFATLLLSGCATLTQEECETGNWEQIGQRDARQGYRPERFNDHVKSCERYKIDLSDRAYLSGYKKGQLHYCTITNGYEVGRKGYVYRGICPASSFSGFEPAYDKGRAIHDIEESISSAAYDRNQVKDQIYVTRKEERTYARDRKLDRLEEQKRRLSDEIERLNAEKERAMVEAELFLRQNVPGL